MSEKRQMNGSPAKMGRLVGLLAFVILTAAICLLSPGSPLRAAPKPALLGGPTDVNGIIDTDTTWTLANSPYIVMGNILISEGITLTIEPGVEVRFDGSYYLQVDGTLVAYGTEESMITFTSNRANPAPGDWGGIYFTPTSQDAVLDSEGNYLQGSVIRYATIEYGGAQPSIMNGVLWFDASPLIANSIISHNKLSISSHSGQPVISNNRIEYNDQHILVWGGEPIIQDNLIRKNRPGAICWNWGSSGGVLSGNVIMQNTGRSCNGDGTINVEPPVIVQRNLIAGNTGSRSAISIRSSRDSVTVTDNTITGNSVDTISLDTYYPELPAPEIHRNNIYDNGGQYDITLMDAFGVPGAEAQENWWGTTDTAVIDQRIYDFYDDFNLGKVSYAPILTAPSTTAPSFLLNLSLDPPSPVTPQPVSISLDFSVPMDTAVSPWVTFGLKSPYTQYQVTSGSWISPTQWVVGNYDLTGMPGGRYTVWVSGAVSAEDGIRVEDTRFGFVVTPVINWILVDTDTDLSPRMNMALAYDSGRGKAVLFGGYGYGTYLNDTWEYDGTDWVQVETANSPLARIFHGLAYDSNRGKVVLFGGRDENGIWLDDTWEYDGVDWTPVNTANTPGGRSAWGMAYDSGRSKVVLFGGKADNDTWEYDGTDWVEVETGTKPPVRSTPRLVYDSGRGKVVLFGGSTDLDDTWVTN